MKVRFMGLLALMALVLASCGGASPEAGGPEEGIQVHGDWTIDIYNEDGSLDEHVEFSNALHPTGKAGLIEYLAGESTPGQWRIWVVGTTEESFGLCPTTGDPQERCIVSPTVETLDLDDEPGREILRLIGDTAVDVDGEIMSATTAQGRCAETTSPTDCTSAGGFPFTEKDVTALDWNNDGTPNDGPIPVSAGQTIQVEVAISFTSG